MLLTLRRLGRERGGDLAAMAVAVVGFWILWSTYGRLSMLAWQYDYANPAVHAKPDYDLTTLPWQTAHPRQFDITSHPATLVTNAEPFAYQLFAIVNRNGARAAAFHFDVTVQSGGVTIGLLQDGKWIASSSTQSPGRFTDSNSTLLGSARSITLVIANNNAGGESRLTVDDIRLYLRQ